MRKQKGVVEIVLVLLLVAAIGAAGHFYLQSRNTQEKPGAKWFVEDDLSSCETDNDCMLYVREWCSEITPCDSADVSDQKVIALNKIMCLRLTPPRKPGALYPQCIASIGGADLYEANCVHRKCVKIKK